MHRQAAPDVASLNIHSPTERHADIGPDARCDVHDRTPLDEMRRWKPASIEPRSWHVAGDEPVEASRVLSNDSVLGAPAPAGISLAPGTLLRLDASSGPERHYDGGEHRSITRRFCVLDGPLTGTCWEAHESTAEDGSWRFADPVEPVDLDTLVSPV